MKHPNQARRLRTLRAATGMNQKQAAAAMGFDATSLSGYELGHTRPWAKNRALIASYYKTPAATLFGTTPQSDGRKMRTPPEVEEVLTMPSPAPLTMRQRIGFWIAGGQA